MARLPFSTARENWPIMTKKANSRKSKQKRRHDTTELPTTIFPAMLCKAAGKRLWITPAQELLARKANIRRSRPALKWPPFKSSKSGQLMCYKTGQVYLLLTGESGFPNYRKLNVTTDGLKRKKQTSIAEWVSSRSSERSSKNEHDTLPGYPNWQTGHRSFRRSVIPSVAGCMPASGDHERSLISIVDGSRSNARGRL